MSEVLGKLQQERIIQSTGHWDEAVALVMLQFQRLIVIFDFHNASFTRLFIKTFH